MVGAGADRRETVRAVGVGEAAPGAGEVGVECARPAVADVAVPARGVGLPQLDQRAGDRSTARVEEATGDDDPLPDRLAAGTDRQVGVGGGDSALAEQRAAQLATVELARVEAQRVVVGVAQVRRSGSRGSRVAGGCPAVPARTSEQFLQCSCSTPHETFPERQSHVVLGEAGGRRCRGRDEAQLRQL